MKQTTTETIIFAEEDMKSAIIALLRSRDIFATPDDIKYVLRGKSGDQCFDHAEVIIKSESEI